MTVLVERGELARLVSLAEVRASRMAQAAGRAPEISEQVPSSGNRLLGLPTNAILDRILVDPSFRRLFDAVLRKGGAFSSVANPPRWPVNTAALSSLGVISAAPTPEEISDLGIADHFYGDYRHQERSQMETPTPQLLLRMTCESTRETMDARFLQSLEGVNWPQVLRATRANRFYCPPAPGFRTTIQLDNVQFFGLSDAVPWARARQTALNVMNLLKVWESYPWPGVVRAYPPAWMRVEQEGLRMLVTQDAPLVKDMIRFWITLATVADYNRIAAIVKEELKEKARRQQFNAIVMAVGLAAIGFMIGAAIAAPMIVKGLTAGLGLVTTKQKEEAAEGLQEAADQLRATDPDFAKEADWSAEYLKYVVALEAVEDKDRREGLPPGTTPVPSAPKPPGTEDKGLTAAVGIAVPAVVSIAAAVLKSG